MTPSRRTFLRALSAAVVGGLIDPEQLAWVPGARTHFLPPRRALGVMDINKATWEFWRNRQIASLASEPMNYARLHAALKDVADQCQGGAVVLTDRRILLTDEQAAGASTIFGLPVREDPNVARHEIRFEQFYRSGRPGPDITE